VGLAGAAEKKNKKILPVRGVKEDEDKRKKKRTGIWWRTGGTEKGIKSTLENVKGAKGEAGVAAKKTSTSPKNDNVAKSKEGGGEGEGEGEKDRSRCEKEVWGKDVRVGPESP